MCFVRPSNVMVVPSQFESTARTASKFYAGSRYRSPDIFQVGLLSDVAPLKFSPVAEI